MIGRVGLNEIRPLGNQVIIIRDKIEKVGSIHLSENAQARATTGRVVATGPGFWNPHTGRTRPCLVKIGDRVAFGPYDGMKCVVDGDLENEFLVMSDESCRCIITKAKGKQGPP